MTFKLHNPKYYRDIFLNKKFIEIREEHIEVRAERKNPL